MVLERFTPVDAMRFQKAIAIVTETLQTSAVYAEGKAFLKAIAIVMETLPMSAVFAVVMGSLKAHVIAMVPCLLTVLIVMAFV